MKQCDQCGTRHDDERDCPTCAMATEISRLRYALEWVVAMSRLDGRQELLNVIRGASPLPDQSED